MNWASYTLIILTLIGLGITIEKHGKGYKAGKNSAWSIILSNIIVWVLLYFTGFFK